MNIRFLSSVFIFVSCFLIQFNANAAIPPIDDSCPVGYRNPDILWNNCLVGGYEYQYKVNDRCENFRQSNPAYTYGYVDKPINDGDNTFYGYVVGIKLEDCAQKESDDPDDGGCYPSDGPQACLPDKDCEFDDGSSFTANQGNSCKDYCQIGSSITNCIDYDPENPDHKGPAGNGPPRTDSDGDGDDDWDCTLEPFMCDYDTNNDGSIDDNDNRDEWPDPTGGLDKGEGCVTSGSEDCGPVEDHHNEDFDGNGDIGNDGIEDGGGGDGGGDGGDGGGGDGGGGDGGDGDGGDGGDSTTPDSSCTDYSSCKSLAFETLQNCLNGDRDIATFFYESPQNYKPECVSCTGPNYLSYTECQAESCPNGYNSEKKQCWTDECPHGDCENPDDPNSTETPPEPERPEEQETDSEQLAALRDILNAIKNGEFATSTDIAEQTQALENAIDNLKNSNKSGNEAIIEELGKLKDALGNDDNPPPDDVDLKPIEDKLDLIAENQKATDCIIQGYDGYSKALEKCLGTVESDLNPNNESLDQIPDAIMQTGIGQSIAKLSSAGQSVSSQCGASMKQSIKLKIGSFVNTTLDLDVCQWLEPVQDFIRLIALLIWGFASFRVLLEA